MAMPLSSKFIGKVCCGKCIIVESFTDILKISIAGQFKTAGNFLKWFNLNCIIQILGIIVPVMKNYMSLSDMCVYSIPHSCPVFHNVYFWLGSMIHVLVLSLVIAHTTELIPCGLSLSLDACKTF
jgi:hypothetical protein